MKSGAFDNSNLSKANKGVNGYPFNYGRTCPIFYIYCYELLKSYSMPIDYSKYSKDWKLRSRFIRFFRAKNRCEECGAENYKPHPITGSKVILTVAHLDHDINNNSFFNLRAMCQRCHLRYDAKHHAETRGKKWNKKMRYVV